MKQERIIKAWHFCKPDRRLGFGDGRVVRSGRTYSVSKDRQLGLRQYGLHASSGVLDALNYAPSSILCRVELIGDVVSCDDLMVAYRRRVISMANIDYILHEFACRCAERALKTDGITDERCWNAITTKRLWLDGKATYAELYAARGAAFSAAQDAAWAAAQADALAAAQTDARDAASRDAARTWQNRCILGLIRKHTNLLDKG